MARSILILLFILVLLVSVSPQVHAKVTETWEIMRPTVVASMDSVYAAIRGLVAGNDTHNRTNELPGTPGTNFDIIIT